MTQFVTMALARSHDRKAFVSGNDALDRYLRDLAFQDIERRVAGCFVALDDAEAIAGLSTLAATHIPLTALPPETRKKLPRYPVVPAMLLGRLAVALDYRRRGLGRALVADAAMRTDGFKIGAFALVADAKDESAAAFYRANDFISIPDEPLRLFLPIATALRAAAEN